MSLKNQLYDCHKAQENAEEPGNSLRVIGKFSFCLRQKQEVNKKIAENRQ
ncbi:MAG: hypothetical protein AB2L24_26775 [Mangrovibacterium sp.]